MEQMVCEVKYGKQQLPLLLPPQTEKLEVKEPSQSITPFLFKKKLTNYLGKLQLDLTHPVIVVADKTRLCGYPEYLPVLVEVLEKNMPENSVLTFIIAYGTHARQSDAECLETYGEIYKRYPFIHHNCEDSQNFVDLGSTALNTPVRYRRDLLNASAIITMGAISHHYFAGYGGGRKLIFPGCGEKAAIFKNHSLFLDVNKGRLEAMCQPGIVASNPLAQDLFEIESHLPAALAVHGILDSKGSLCDLILGRTQQDFLEACNLHGKNCESNAAQYNLVVASCGGFPKDINFIQSHKAIHNGAMFVEDGGLLLVYCECRDGIGSKTFLPWFRYRLFSEAFAELAKDYKGNGGTALSLMAKLQRIRIGLITELDQETCKLIGVEHWHHEQVLTHLKNQPATKRTAFISNGSLLVKRSDPR